MELNNIVYRRDDFVVTEEVNCYLIWYLVFGWNINDKVIFGGSKATALAIAVGKIGTMISLKENYDREKNRRPD